MPAVPPPRPAIVVAARATPAPSFASALTVGTTAAPAAPTTPPAPQDPLAAPQDPLAVPEDPLAAAGLPSTDAWRHAVRRTRAWARAQPQRIRFALRVEKTDLSFRGRDTTHSNSLIKATVLIAYLRRSSVRGRPLSGRERAQLTPMIRESANGPVSSLITAMGGLRPLRDVGRLVGMRDFVPVRGSWGASRISAADEVRLFSRLWTVLPPRHRRYALGLLRSIVPSQRWGMPEAAPRGFRVTFKSGWDGRGRVVQAMRLDCKGRLVTASVLVDGSSQGGSVTAVERTGRRLLQPLRARGADACSKVIRASGQARRRAAGRAGPPARPPAVP